MPDMSLIKKIKLKFRVKKIKRSFRGLNCFIIIFFFCIKTTITIYEYFQDIVIMKFVQMISFLKYDIIKMKAKCLGLNKFMKFFFYPIFSPGNE